MTAHSRRLWRERQPPRIPDEIHPVWCACSDCRMEAERRAFRLDLLVIGLGVAAALGALAINAVGGF